MATLEQIMTETPIMPQSPEAEKIVIATLLSSEQDFTESRERLTPDTFYVTKHRDIYEAMLRVADAGEHVDILTVLNECQKSKSDVTPYELAELARNYTPFLNDHINILIEKRKRRKFFEIGALLQSNAFSEANEVNQVLSEVRERLDEVATSSTDNVCTIKDAVEAMYANISRNMSGGGELTGNPTGFSQLDKRSGGLQTSDLVIIAADSSQGKTSLAVKFAINCGCPVAFYSMEMKKEQVAARMVSIETGIPSNEILYSKLASGQLKMIDRGVAKVVERPVYFDDRSTSNIDTILSSIRMMKLKYDIKGAFVDYLQILNVNMKSSNKEQQMGDVARRLKNIAKELDIWVVALSQLSRDNQNPVPTLSRLRDSGQIAEAADMVILIYRPEVYGKKYPDNFSDKETKGTAMLDVAKGRNVGLMKFIVGFEPENTNFYELDRVPVYQRIEEDSPHGLPF